MIAKNKMNHANSGESSLSTIIPSTQIYIYNTLLTNNLVPPIPVFIKRGIRSADFWINILLCLLGFLPGLLHSYYIISMYPYREGYARLGGDGHNNRSGDYGATVG
ncbi:hypothetical protein DFJ63DRAFT_341639 [Scheffersomyces coipomensis]|uniref:uncharacterized protein n=1 Tax=Scheffersomyces coipomensis TaxID=1788519 RepID=UPI00315D0094